MKYSKKVIFDLDCLSDDLDIYGPGGSSEDALRGRIKSLRDIIESVYANDDNPTWPMDFDRELRDIVKRYYEIKRDPIDLT
jgi:hypothetical protein